MLDSGSLGGCVFGRASTAVARSSFVAGRATRSAIFVAHFCGLMFGSGADLFDVVGWSECQ